MVQWIKNNLIYLSISTALIVLANLGNALPGLPVKTSVLQEESQFKEKRIFIGRVEACQTSRLGFEIGGKLNAVIVDEGDRIKEGDILAQIDTVRLQAARKEAEAALEEAKTALSLSESTLERVKAAAAIQAVSVQELDVALENRNSAVATVKRHQAALERIDVDVGKSLLKAPFRGIVTQRLADPGRIISAGTPVLSVQDNLAPEVRIALAGGLADAFSLGDAVSLHSYGRDLSAIVKAILPVRDPQAGTVDIILSLAKDSQARPGDLVEMVTEYSIQRSGFWVPLSSLTETIRGLWSVYTIDSQGKAQRKVVDLLYLDGDRAYVRGNLKTGEKIIADGTHRLVPGQALKAVES